MIPMRRSLRGTSWLPVWALLAGCGLVEAQPAAVPRAVTTPHATVELVAASTQPSAPPTLGLRFRLQPGWHVYWRNPGDSGGPPTIRWVQLPQGWTAGEFEWPVPERIPLGPLVNYGYTGDVVLPVAMTATRAGSSGAPGAALVADVRWLACHDICVPGKATLGVTWPVAEAERGQIAEWSRLIGEARRRVPPKVPPSWRVTARADREAFVVSIRGDGRVGRGTFFPIDEGQVNESAPQKVDVVGREARFTLRRSDLLTTTPKVLRGVVKFDSGPAYEVAARLTED